MQYAAVAGIVGVVAYAISCGLPILMIGGFGGRITRDLPHVFSLGDFIGWRFGPIARTLLFLMTMFMMCIFTLAEYTTIGTIFSAFVGTLDWPIIVLVGVVTLTYTAYGGLAVSIATDQVQGICSMLLALILTIYVAVTYRCERGVRC
jgi:Na+/proline symporter